MKRFLISFLVISVGLNVALILLKIKRINRGIEVKKLLTYKKISYEEGYDYFLKQMREDYPETTIDNKYFIVYRWDSVYYDDIYRRQMMALDSMAADFGKYKFEYIFVTEMDEDASTAFLKRSDCEYKNVKMLYGMDDFISGLHNIKGLKFLKPIVNNVTRSAHVMDSSFYFLKQLSFYSVIGHDGEVLFTNKKGAVLKDTAFLNKLNGLLPEKNLKILN